MTTDLEITETTKNLEITEVNGRTKIVFKKAILMGKVSSADVLNTILIAARLQAEKYIEKLGRGAPLDTTEVKALKELAEITKLEPSQSSKPEITITSPEAEIVKSTLYQALTDRLSNSSKSAKE